MTLPSKCTDVEGGPRASLPGHGEQCLEAWRTGKDCYGLYKWYLSLPKCRCCGVGHTMILPLEGP